MTGSKRSSRQAIGVLLPLVALLVVVALTRRIFVGALARLTGTWIGGVESPHRVARGPSEAESEG